MFHLTSPSITNIRCWCLFYYIYLKIKTIVMLTSTYDGERALASKSVFYIHAQYSNTIFMNSVLIEYTWKQQTFTNFKITITICLGTYIVTIASKPFSNCVWSCYTSLLTIIIYYQHSELLQYKLFCMK